MTKEEQYASTYDSIVAEIAKGICEHSNCLEQAEVNTITHLAKICKDVQKLVHENIYGENDNYKDGWVCQHCGKSTFETDYENLFSPQEHIGCALEAEKEVDAQKEIRKDDPLRKEVYDKNNNLKLKVPEIKHPEWLV